MSSGVCSTVAIAPPSVDFAEGREPRPRSPRVAPLVLRVRAPYNRLMLLGRDRERHDLDAALANARLSESTALVLQGEAGIGKSTLLEYGAEQARGSHMRVLRARGIESEARVPFAGLLELLRPALGALKRIAEPQRAAREIDRALRPATAYDRFAVGAATLNLLAAHAEDAPVAAFVDDAQWLDGSTA